MKSEQPTIETYTGLMFDIMNPTPDMIRIEDIAHAGSQICRFTGHTKFHYSVDQHEFIGSFLVPRQNALEFLLHDAAESYVNDMSRAIKHMTLAGAHYRMIEDNIQSVIRDKYGLPAVQTPVIHTVDNMMLWAEKKQLMTNAVWTEELTKRCKVNTNEAADVRIIEMHPRYAERIFLDRFEELTGTFIGEQNANHQHWI